MNLNHLSLFHAVAEEGSVSRGAARLHISQPAVSKQLSEFERWVGTPLFDRVSKGVRLTQAGELLHTYSRRLFAVEKEAELALQELRGLERGRLLIGASTSIGAYLLPPILAAFHFSYPHIEIILEIRNTDFIQKALEEEGLDLGFTEGFVHGEGLEAQVFYEDELVPIASPNHPFARQNHPVTLEQLCAEPFLVREVGSGTREVIEAALRTCGLSLRPIMTLGNTEAIKRAVMGGSGIAIVSQLTVQNEIKDGKLAILDVMNFTLHRPLHQVQVRGHHLPASARAFSKTLRAAIAHRQNQI